MTQKELDPKNNEPNKQAYKQIAYGVSSILFGITLLINTLAPLSDKIQALIDEKIERFSLVVDITMDFIPYIMFLVCAFLVASIIEKAVHAFALYRSDKRQSVYREQLRKECEEKRRIVSNNNTDL